MPALYAMPLLRVLLADPTAASPRDRIQQRSSYLADELHLFALNPLLTAPNHNHDYTTIVAEDTQSAIQPTRLVARA